MVYGSVQDFDPAVRWYAEASGVMLVGVDYRLAPEHPYPAAVDDALAALRWIHAHSSELDVDPRLIGVIGESGGACVAAAAALQAHDEGLPRLRRQILIEPMLDDRTVRPDPSLAAGATWTYELNAMAWSAVAGAMDAAGTPYLAPARASTLAPGLPPAYIDVGSRDIFRNEAMTYAGRLLSAGVEVEHHLYPGMPHGFAGSAPTHPQSQLALRLRAAALMSLAQPM
jgi:acetyl esterase/lipase